MDRTLKETNQGRKQRLHQKIDELQQKWELLSEKLSGLEKDNVLENRSDEKLRLQKKIAELQAERQQVEDQLKDLEGSLAQAATDGKPEKIEKIDEIEAIIKFNLEKLVYKFTPGLKYGSPVAFTVGGYYDIVEYYIVKRLKWELENRPGIRRVVKCDLRLRKGDIEQGKPLIETRFCKCLDYKHPGAFFQDGPSDKLLIVWNYDIPKAQMRLFASSFWETVKGRVTPLIPKLNRRFIVLYANVSGTPLKQEPFITLPTPKNLDISDLLSWFRDILKSRGFGDEVIEGYLKRLEHHDGQLYATYHEMKHIVWEANQNISGR